MLELIEAHLLQKQAPVLVRGPHCCGNVLHVSRVRMDEVCCLAQRGVVRIPFRRKLFLVSLSWCRGSDGKMDVAHIRQRLHPFPLRIILGNNCRGRRIRMDP